MKTSRKVQPPTSFALLVVLCTLQRWTRFIGHLLKYNKGVGSVAHGMALPLQPSDFTVDILSNPSTDNGRSGIDHWL